jgi:peptidoglycan/LPS O-acetylase OafA/YrhL
VGLAPSVAEVGVRQAGVRQAGEIRSARLESLRALAALAVLEGHVYGDGVKYGRSAYDSWWHRTLLGGGFGVYLFFALSGYLLFLPFARRSFGGGRTINLGTYVRNRAVRILPLYYVVAVTYLIVFHSGLRLWVGFLTFTENFSVSTVGRVDGPMWSLVVEVMFYALLPLLALGLARLAQGSLAKAAGALIVLGAVAGAYRWVAYLHPSHPGPLVQYNLPATFFFFVPGMLLALARVATERRGLAGARGPLGWSSAWLAASVACWSLVFWRYNWDLLAGLASFLLVGACVLPLRRSAAVSALDWRPLAILGTASYSLYLWHLPIVDALAPRPLGGYLGHLAVAVAVCVLVALVSYQLVESPFLRLRHGWGDTAAVQAPGLHAGRASTSPPSVGSETGAARIWSRVMSYRPRLGITRLPRSGR